MISKSPCDVLAMVVLAHRVKLRSPEEQHRPDTVSVYGSKARVVDSTLMKPSQSRRIPGVSLLSGVKPIGGKRQIFNYF